MRTDTPESAAREHLIPSEFGKARVVKCRQTVYKTPV